MAPEPLTIAAVAAPFGRDIDAALERMRATIAEARAAGARLIVFPETTLGGYVLEPEHEHDVLDLPPSLDRDGPEVRAVMRMAGDAVVCFGMTEASEDGGRRNVALAVSGDGVLGRHEKVHLPPAERFAYAPGDRFAAFDTPVGRMGMVVCYDKLLPEAARALTADGADVIASLAAWPTDRNRPADRIEDDRQLRHFDVVDVCRAVENQVTWVSANLAGPWGARQFLGSAKVVDPDGTVRAATGPRAGLAVATVDVAAARRVATLEVDHLADRRPAAYGAMTGAVPSAAEPVLAPAVSG